MGLKAAREIIGITSAMPIMKPMDSGIANTANARTMDQRALLLKWAMASNYSSIKRNGISTVNIQAITGCGLSTKALNGSAGVTRI